MSLLLPQVTLAAGALAAIVLSLFASPGPRGWRLLTLATLFGAIGLALREWAFASSLAIDPALTAVSAPLVRLDPLGAAFQILLYAAAIPVALLGRAEDEVPVVLLLGSVCGMGLLAVSANLLLLFVALELMSIPAYLLVWKWSWAGRGEEAAVKYFFAGATAGALFLMGLTIHYAAGPEPAPLLLEFAMVMMGAAALFKVGAVPLHFWLPDVYQASRPELSGFLSTAVKGSAVLLLLRVSALGPDSAFSEALPAIGALTALAGALLAWRQRALQRLLAYSSISHAGFLVLGAGVWVSLPEGPARFEAARALLFYLGAYVFMSNGAFAFVKASVTGSRDELRGYAAARPGLAAALSVILLSLAGIPPLAGFIAKFLIFWEALEAGALGPVLVGGIATLVALGYYLGIVRDMYFEPSTGALPAAAPSFRVLWTCAAASIVLGILPWLVPGSPAGEVVSR